LQTITLGNPFWAGRRLLSSACDPVAAALGTEPLVLVDRSCLRGSDIRRAPSCTSRFRDRTGDLTNISSAQLEPGAPVVASNTFVAGRMYSREIPCYSSGEDQGIRTI